MKTKMFFCAVVAMILLSGAIAAGQEKRELIGQNWRWVSTHEASGSTITPNHTGIFGLYFGTDIVLRCFSDCNNYQASFDISATGAQTVGTGNGYTGLSFGAFTGADTDGCEGSQEFVYMDYIQHVDAYMINGEFLMLRLKDGGGQMVFQARDH